MTNWEELAARCKGRWMMGGSAVSEATGTVLAPIVGEGNDAELKLLAAVGQSLQVCFQPTSTDKLSCKPELPPLEFETMPEESRQCFRRSIAHINAVTSRDVDSLIFLAAARNYAIHPADWFPKSSSAKLPDIYHPWLDWLEKDTDKGTESDREISSETWDEFLPAARCQLLRAMRRSNPEEALTLIVENSASEPAEKRLKIIEVLDEGLSESDVEFLESLDSDRSGKIRTLANQFLMRLGVRKGSQDELDELLDFLTVKAKSSERDSITARGLKTKAQKNRRTELFNKISLKEVASSLEWSEDRVVDLWSPPAKDIRATDDFCAMVALTGSQQSVAALANRFADQSDCSTDALVTLCERLSDEERGDIAARCLKVHLVGKSESVLSRALACAGNALGNLSFDQIDSNSEYKALLKLAKVSSGTNEKKANVANVKIGHYLTPVSLLADQHAAGQILSSLKKEGIPEFDTRLNYLRFNASLVTKA